MKKDALILKWSKRERDIVCNYPDNGKHDAALAFNCFGGKRHHPLPYPQGVWDDSFFDELKARGYDITTLRFSIKKNPTP